MFFIFNPYQFIVYDLDEQVVFLTSTQDIDFKNFGQPLPRIIKSQL